MRNPHGTVASCKEWTGDWSDNSELWTPQAKSSLNYEPNTEENDGIFWMNVSDFRTEFFKLYVTRELNAMTGWHSLKIESSWFGPSAASFPTKLRQVPQFKLTITKPTPGFISLTQTDESGSSFKGKNFVGWMVSCEQGKIMTKINK